MLNIRKPDLTPLGRGRSTWTTTTSSGGEVVTSVFPSAGVRWTSRGSDLDMYDRAPIGSPNGTPHFSPHAFCLLTPLAQTSNSSAQTCTTSPAKNPTWAPHPAPQAPVLTPTHTLASCTTPPNTLLYPSLYSPDRISLGRNGINGHIRPVSTLECGVSEMRGARPPDESGRGDSVV